jgi:hypothetical protein
MTTQTLTGKIWSELTKERHNTLVDATIGTIEWTSSLMIPAHVGGNYISQRGKRNILSAGDSAVIIPISILGGTANMIYTLMGYMGTGTVAAEALQIDPTMPMITSGGIALLGAGYNAVYSLSTGKGPMTDWGEPPVKNEP